MQLTEPTLFDEARRNGSRRDYPEAHRFSRWTVARYKRLGPPPAGSYFAEIAAMFDELDRLRCRVAELETRAERQDA